MTSPLLTSMNAQQIMNKLRERGYKVTPQRLAVCELILSSKDHPSSVQVYQKVKKKHPTISLATIYQTLHLLTKLGLVQELGFSDRISRYEPNTSPHINVICQKCGEIRDYETKNVKTAWTKIIEELEFKPTGQRLDVYKHCNKCRDRSPRYPV